MSLCYAAAAAAAHLVVLSDDRDQVHVEDVFPVQETRG